MIEIVLICKNSISISSMGDILNCEAGDIFLLTIGGFAMYTLINGKNGMQIYPLHTDIIVEMFRDNFEFLGQL